jgi:5-methylcytosine-specific restriction endonuclease McrA
MDPILPDSKACTKCLVEKSFDSYHKQIASKDGYKSECKPCIKARRIVYEAENRETIAAKRAARYLKNADKILKQKAAYYKENIDALSIKMAAYYRENADKIASRKANYRLLNADKLSAARAASRVEYPDREREHARRRRARKLDNGVEYYTESQVLELYGTDCYLCNGPIDLEAARRAGQEGWQFSLHVDHVQPLSKGGPDSLANVRPAHGLCNLKKHDTWDDPA